MDLSADFINLKGPYNYEIFCSVSSEDSSTHNKRITFGQTLNYHYILELWHLFSRSIFKYRSNDRCVEYFSCIEIIEPTVGVLGTSPNDDSWHSRT